MTAKETIGEITVQSEHDVDWKIDNFFSFTENDEFHYSPSFTVFNCKWYFKIYPNGKEHKAGCISLYLMSKSSSNESATYSFGIRKCDGKVEKVKHSLSWIFYDEGYGYPEFLKRSELIKQKSKLAASDSLTITCTLWGYDDFDSTAKTNSLSNNFLDLFTSQKACDTTLEVKQEQFSVHKLILMARSPVFAAMFETPMKEKTTGVVHIEDCDPEAFRDFLVYLYSGRLEKLTHHMFELYEIADKYDVQDLKADCRMALMGNLSVENVSDAAILADKFKDNAIKIKVKNFFNENYREIFRTSEWVTLMAMKSKLASEMLKNMADYLGKNL